MLIPKRRLQKLLAPLMMTCVCFQSCLSFAQNPPSAAAESVASASAPAAPEKPVYTSNLERDNELLAKAFTAIAKSDELLWLQTPDEKVLSLYKAGETRKTLGLLLIMHAPETPQLWPANLENLRLNLPLYSWATIALPLPSKYASTAPQRDQTSIATSVSSEAGSTPSETNATASSAAVETSKPLVTRDKLIAGRVSAAVGEINKLGKLDLAVLVDNSSAPDALAALYPQVSIAKGVTTESNLKALVLVNLQDQEPLTATQLSAIFASSDLRVLDVFFNTADKAQIELRRTHKAEAMRKNIKDYRQVVLPAQPNVSTQDTQSFWLGKVHGFLTRKLEDNSRSSANKSSLQAN